MKVYFLVAAGFISHVLNVGAELNNQQSSSGIKCLILPHFLH